MALNEGVVSNCIQRLANMSDEEITAEYERLKNLKFTGTLKIMCVFNITTITAQFCR